MKKAISLLLAFIIVFSLCIPAFAAKECSCEILPVVYVPGFGAGIYQNPGTEEEVAVFPPEQEAFDEALPDIIKAVVMGLIFRNYEAFGTYAIKAATPLIGGMACNPDGTSPENVGTEPCKTPSFDSHQITNYEFSATDVDESVGEYYFLYDWRLDPVENAKELKVFIEAVKAVTGHDEIVLSCHSQGNTVVASYLHLYGSDGISKLIFLSPAFKGLSLVGTLLTRTATVEDKGEAVTEFVKGIMDYDLVQNQLIIALLSSLEKAGILDALLGLLQDILDSQLDRVFDEFLIDVMGTMPGVWSFVPDEYYEAAKKSIFRGLEKYSKLEEKTDYYHYNIQNNVEKLIDEALTNGTSVFISAGYNISNIPITPGKAEHSDFMIDTKYMTIGATCAPIGETLGSGHSQIGTDCGHNHISPDKKIDASTCAYPEYTWFVKGNAHNAFDTEYRNFIKWAILFDGQPTIRSNEQYPQFLEEKDGVLCGSDGSEFKETRSNLKIIFESLAAMIKEAISKN